MKYTVKKGFRYYAQLRLEGFEGLATNAQIIEKLKEAGFSDIQVSGNGTYRGASGTWMNEDKQAELPNEIYNVEMVGSITDGGGKATESETGGGAA